MEATSAFGRRIAMTKTRQICRELTGSPTSMTLKHPPQPPAPHRFLRGSRCDVPMLVPMVPQRSGGREMIRFSRQVCPGAPMFVPNIGALGGGNAGAGHGADVRTVNRVAEVIESLLHNQGLTLVPVVALGHGRGADLALRLIAMKPTLITACILLRPTLSNVGGPFIVLDGVTVLLARAASGDGVGNVGWQLRNALVRAGAHVVFERVARRSTIGEREAAIARVFIATLFGDFP